MSGVSQHTCLLCHRVQARGETLSWMARKVNSVVREGAVSGQGHKRESTICICTHVFVSSFVLFCFAFVDWRLFVCASAPKSYENCCFMIWSWDLGPGHDLHVATLVRNACFDVTIVSVSYLLV